LDDGIAARRRALKEVEVSHDDEWGST
jgi:hypothetical protein